MGEGKIIDTRIQKLLNTWFYLKTNVSEFEILFSDDKNIADLRGSLLPDFFENLQVLYWEHFLITIARLLDPHEQGNNVNLSLFTLVEILKKRENNQWKCLNEKLIKLKEDNKDIINYRKKYLAHFDLKFATGEKPLNTSTHINEVHSFLDSMLEMLNLTLKYIGEEPIVIGGIYLARYIGAKEFMKILERESQFRAMNSAELNRPIIIRIRQKIRDLLLGTFFSSGRCFCC